MAYRDAEMLKEARETGEGINGSLTVLQKDVSSSSVRRFSEPVSLMASTECGFSAVCVLNPRLDFLLRCL